MTFNPAQWINQPNGLISPIDQLTNRGIPAATSAGLMGNGPVRFFGASANLVGFWREI
jgi:hypothetical protein